MRRRTYTEMIGCNVPKAQYEMLKAEMKKRRMTVSQYLRATAIDPLMAELAQQAAQGLDQHD